MLTVLAEGMTSREMGEKVVVSPKTVDRHRENIMSKLNLHSRVELVRKLSVDFAAEAVLIERVLDQLAAEGLQSDTRFAEALVASRVRRGQGPQRIRRELAERGIDAELVQHTLTTADVDWCALALTVSTQKFGRKSAQDWPERARRARFLQYRGFGADEIQAILAGQSRDDNIDTL